MCRFLSINYFVKVIYDVFKCKYVICVFFKFFIFFCVWIFFSMKINYVSIMYNNCCFKFYLINLNLFKIISLFIIFRIFGKLILKYL